MMFWWGDHMSGWGWSLMTVSAIAFLALATAAIVALVHSRGVGAERWPQPPAGATPEQILAERCARGEIDEPEYRRRMAALDATGVADGDTGIR